MGDHAGSVAKQVRKLAPFPPLKRYVDLPAMGELAATLVGAILRALVDVDVAAARAVAARDDEIDTLYHRTFDEVVSLMRADPDNVDHGTRILFAAHYLERIGDRVTTSRGRRVLGPARSKISPMTEPIRVLFVCTATPQEHLAEALLRHHGGAEFEVHSAGTEPKGTTRDRAVLDEAGLEHGWARSKSVSEYLGQTFDYVVTVGARLVRAAGLPRRPRALHWGYEDPAAAEGTEEQRLTAFARR